MSTDAHASDAAVAGDEMLDMNQSTDPQHSPLSTAAIRAALQTRWLGRDGRFLERVDSTNDHLRALAAARHLPSGALLASDYQRRGRGRGGRRWLAPAGTSLLFSLYLRPDWPAERAAWLMMIAGQAAAEAITAETALPVGLKWPNDIVVGDAAGWRKLGGILLESELENDRLAQAIVGIGINVNIPAEQLPAVAPPATSLRVELGRPVDRLALLVALLTRLERYLDAAEEGHSPHKAWAERLIMLGAPVRVTPLDRPGAAVDGRAAGVDAWGRLLVRDADGREHAFAAGDVSLRGGP